MKIRNQVEKKRQSEECGDLKKIKKTRLSSPVDNRPSTDKLDLFYDTWDMTPDT